MMMKQLAEWTLKTFCKVAGRNWPVTRSCLACGDHTLAGGGALGALCPASTVGMPVSP